MKVDLDTIEILVDAVGVLLLGGRARFWVTVLPRFNIPVPVTGGIVVALATTALYLGADVELAFDTELRLPLMVNFFT